MKKFFKVPSKKLIKEKEVQNQVIKDLHFEKVLQICFLQVRHVLEIYQRIFAHKQSMH
jgi:hypothetical protein